MASTLHWWCTTVPFADNGNPFKDVWNLTEPHDISIWLSYAALHKISITLTTQVHSKSVNINSIPEFSNKIHITPNRRNQYETWKSMPANITGVMRWNYLNSVMNFPQISTVRLQKLVVTTSTLTSSNGTTKLHKN